MGGQGDVQYEALEYGIQVGMREPKAGGVYFKAGPSRTGTGPRAIQSLWAPLMVPIGMGAVDIKHHTAGGKYIAFVYWVINYSFIVSRFIYIMWRN